MSWIDRLKESAYTPTSGTRIKFSYENVSLELDKKSSSFEFADANGTYVQQNGNTSRRYPLLCYFWGTDYDIESANFIKALEEDGVGKLEHPIYGNINVVPFGTIRRRDDLKDASNQAIIEVTFWNTIDIIYPSSQNDSGSLVISSIEEYNLTTANNFSNTLDLSSETKKATFGNGFQSILNETSSGLGDIAKTTKGVDTEFKAITDSINSSIDTLVSDPTTLASQTLQMVQSPSRAVTSITSKLNSYGNLINSITGKSASDKNDYSSKNLYASTYVTGQILSSLNNEFETKTDALTVAELILNQMEDLTNWSDEQRELLDLIDTGESYQQLQESVAITAGFLVEISFTLKQEKSIILDRNRTIVDLVGELYGRVDEELDFIINSNNLSGSEILELPKGREILYYV